MTTIDFPILQVKRNRISRTRVLAISLVALGLTGCVTDSGGPASSSASSVTRVDQAAPVRINYLTPAAAFELHKQQQAMIVDIGPRAVYDNWHIRGAAHLSPDDLAKLSANVPRVMILYDTGLNNVYLDNVQSVLRQRPEVFRVIKGGLAAWQSAGLPVDGHPQAPFNCEAVTPDALRLALRDGVEITLIDLRATQEFEAAHIAAAQHSMPDKFPGTLKSLKKSNRVIVYDHNGQLGQHLATELSRQKFPFCGYLAGGYQAWSSPAPNSSRK